MGTGQMLLVLVALTILAGVTISANKLVLNQADVVQGSEAMITGTAIGQAMVEKITVKYFDQKMLPPLFTDEPDSLTPASKLGPDPGETVDTTFNDVNDYNGYKDSVNTPRLGYFVRTCRVYYVSENSPDVNAGTQTFLKKIEVTVRNPYLGTPGDTVVVSKIVSYRYKH